MIMIAEAACTTTQNVREVLHEVFDTRRRAANMLYVSVFTCMYMYTHNYVYMYMCTYTDVYMCIYMCIHIYIYIYMYICTIIY